MPGSALTARPASQKQQDILVIAAPLAAYLLDREVQAVGLKTPERNAAPLPHVGFVKHVGHDRPVLRRLIRNRKQLLTRLHPLELRCYRFLCVGTAREPTPLRYRLLGPELKKSNPACSLLGVHLRRRPTLFSLQSLDTHQLLERCGY